MTRDGVAAWRISECAGLRPTSHFCDTVRRRATRRNGLTSTFNPKVPGSRPGRPTSSNKYGLSVPPIVWSHAFQERIR